MMMRLDFEDGTKYDLRVLHCPYLLFALLVSCNVREPADLQHPSGNVANETDTLLCARALVLRPTERERRKGDEKGLARPS